MRAARWFFLACASMASSFAGYVYDAPNLLNPYNSPSWTANGVNNAGTGMYTSAHATGGSLMWGSAVPGVSNSYEVRTTLTLSSSGGNYNVYLRGGSNSLLANGNAASFYAVQIAN